MQCDPLDPIELEELLDVARRAGCTRLVVTADRVEADFGSTVPAPVVQPAQSVQTAKQPLTGDVRDKRLWRNGPPSFRPPTPEAPVES